MPPKKRKAEIAPQAQPNDALIMVQVKQAAYQCIVNAELVNNQLKTMNSDFRIFDEQKTLKFAKEAREHTNYLEGAIHEYEQLLKKSTQRIMELQQIVATQDKELAHLTENFSKDLTQGLQLTPFSTPKKDDYSPKRPTGSSSNRKLRM